MEKLLKEAEAAKFLGLHVNTLRRLRYDGKGPKFIEFKNRLIRYRKEDLIAFVMSKAKK